MTILILGAGQLARMMCLAGAPLNLNVVAYDVGSKKIVHPLTGQIYTTTLEQAIVDAHAITAEFEHKKALLELEKSRIDAGVSKQFVSLFDFEKAAIEFQKQQLAVEKAQRQLLTRQEEMASEIKKLKFKKHNLN